MTRSEIHNRLEGEVEAFALDAMRYGGLAKQTIWGWLSPELVRLEKASGAIGRCPKYGGPPQKCRRCGRPPNNLEGFCLECHRCISCCERSKSESRD